MKLPATGFGGYTRSFHAVESVRRGIDRAALITRLRAVLPPDMLPAPLHEPEFSERERTLLVQCLDRGWVSWAGQFLGQFEATVAYRTSRRHAIATINGTAALHVALTVAGVRRGDEVLMPALTFVATANAAAYCGAVPHFVDSTDTTLGLDPVALDRRLRRIAAPGEAGGVVNRETGRPIRAVVPVHLFGHPCDDDAIAEIAQHYGIAMVTDATESLGSLYKGRPAAGAGRLAVLSFNGNKIVTTGGGGAVVTDDDALARRLRHLTTTAKTPHTWAVAHDEIGFNYRMPALNAALGLAQLERLEDFVARKRRLAKRYRDACANLDGVTVFQEPAFACSNYWLNAILLDPDVAGERDVLLSDLLGAGLQCRPAWTGMHRLPMYHDCPRMDLPVAEELERRLINLPSSPRYAGD
jgi:perosamine synthetase